MNVPELLKAAGNRADQVHAELLKQGLIKDDSKTEGQSTAKEGADAPKKSAPKAKKKAKVKKS